MDLFVAAYTMVSDTFSSRYSVTIAYMLHCPGSIRENGCLRYLGCVCLIESSPVTKARYQTLSSVNLAAQTRPTKFILV